MCRPSCCNNSGSQGSGIAAVALLIGAALVAAKIGPIVAHIINVVLNVIRLAALTTGLVVALAVFTWAVIVVTRWQRRRRALAAAQTPVVAKPTIRVSRGSSQRRGRLPGLWWHRHGAARHQR